MSFSVSDLFRAVLLILNALAILSEKRFLFPLGLSSSTASSTSTPFAAPSGFGFEEHNRNVGMFGEAAAVPSPSQLKVQIAQLLSSVRLLLRWPLIFTNALMIVFALIFG